MTLCPITATKWIQLQFYPFPSFFDRRVISWPHWGQGFTVDASAWVWSVKKCGARRVHSVSVIVSITMYTLSIVDISWLSLHTTTYLLLQLVGPLHQGTETAPRQVLKPANSKPTLNMFNKNSIKYIFIYVIYTPQSVQILNVVKNEFYLSLN